MPSNHLEDDIQHCSDRNVSVGRGDIVKGKSYQRGRKISILPLLRICVVKIPITIVNQEWGPKRTARERSLESKQINHALEEKSVLFRGGNLNYQQFFKYNVKHIRTMWQECRKKHREWKTWKEIENNQKHIKCKRTHAHDDWLLIRSNKRKTMKLPL